MARMSTYYIDPSPACLDVLIISAGDNQSHNCNSYNTAEEHAEYRLAWSRAWVSSRSLIEAPKRRNELCQKQGAQDNCMRSESQVVESDSRLKSMVPLCILLSYYRRVQEGSIRDEVRNEA